MCVGGGGGGVTGEKGTERLPETNPGILKYAFVRSKVN